MGLQLQFNLYVKRIILTLFCIFPFIVFPFPVNMPSSKGYGLVYYDAVDLFELYKFVFFICLSIIMLFLLTVKVLLLKQRLFFSMPLVIFTGLVVLSTLFANNLQTAFFGMPTKWQGLLCYLCYLVVFTFVYNAYTKKDTALYIKYLSLSSAIVGLLTLFNFFGWDVYHRFFQASFALEYNPDIIKAPIGNRISMGAYFSLLFPISLFALLDKKHPYLYGVTTVLSFLGLLLSQSRTAWLGTLMGIVLIVFLYRKSLTQLLKSLMLFALCLAMLVAVMDFFGERKITARIVDLKSQLIILQETKNLNAFGTMRGFIYDRALQLIQKHPILGVGPDCFYYFGILTPEDYQKYPEWRSTTIITKAHSEYLEIAATIGIPALICYLVFIGLILLPYFKKQIPLTPNSLGLLAGFLSYLIQAAGNIGVISVLPIFFCLAAMLCRTPQHQRQRFFGHPNICFLFSEKKGL